MPDTPKSPATGTYIEIAKWNEIFESAWSRKRKKLDWYQAPVGVQSNGYLTLVEAGAAGLAALGVFTALCQLSATYPTERRGRFINADGSPMSIQRLATLTGIDKELLLDAIDLLSADNVRWLSERPATDLPPICQSSASDVPEKCQSKKERKTEREKETGACAPEEVPSPLPFPEQTASGQTLPDLVRRINGWFKLPADTRWTPQQHTDLLVAERWDAETWDLLALFYLAPEPTDADPDHPLRFRRRSVNALLANLPGELSKAIAWAESRPAAAAPRSPAPAARHHAPPCDDWRPLAAEIFPAEAVESIDYADLGDEAQRQIWHHHEKKAARLESQAA